MEGNDPYDLLRKKYFRHRNRKCKNLITRMCFGIEGTTGRENQPKGDGTGAGVRSEDRPHKDV